MYQEQLGAIWSESKGFPTTIPGAHSASSDVSHTLSDVSTPSLNECFRASQLPVAGFTPTRDQHSRCNFPWSDAPLHWPTSERLLFYKLKRRMLYPRLWRLYATTNNYQSWYAINSAPGHNDLKVFIRECNSLHVSLHQDTVLHLRYGLSGGWQDFPIEHPSDQLLCWSLALHCPARGCIHLQ